MSHYTLHPHGIYQIRLPMGNPPWMNSYLLPDGNGYTLIDPGFNTEAIIALWHEISKDIRFTWDQIRKIIVTHHHPDHYGLAGWFQQHSHAPVYVSTIAKKQIEGLWGEGRPLVSLFLETYQKNGLPEDLIEQLGELLKKNVQQVLPHPTLTTLDEGETIQIGDATFEVLHIPGHAAGHSALYSKDLQVIFVGDQVMPDSLPDTCYVSDEFDPNPIHSFIQSLDKLKPYSVQLAFPGHHQPFAHFGERLEQLKELNAERQQKVVDQFTTEEWKTAYEAYYGVFEPVPALIQKRFHFTETLSRVRYALSEGLIEQTEQNGIVKYRKV
ncbi:Glyoxylase, beta-lactamase superfamily II [Paenibacillus sp. 1_12]|uniref:MBL fold metallo-hydrolase n=1 Tax=Paenibacillus sp. 1_12 TaxID=1566278 RepID=UPI0008F26EFE|nr:MBL fold metallo-hydrolase [Paenibacillus sp. 1_12]SFL00595.1 Glyoxylase, beta-lactamase superfamily II [Paenibacillus sp. 1_12]